MPKYECCGCGKENQYQAKDNSREETVFAWTTSETLKNGSSSPKYLYLKCQWCNTNNKVEQ